MLKLIIDQLDLLSRDASINDVHTQLNEITIDSEEKNTISSTVNTFSSPFFATEFVSDSYKNSFASIHIQDKKRSLCKIFYSTMIDGNTNFLLGIVNEVSFIVCQHVTSCDFIYFPKFKYYHTVSHAELNDGFKVLQKLSKSLVNSHDKNYITEKKLRGLIMSHGRPYHFFYDTALAVEDLYQKELLDKFNHYQIKNCDFLEFNNMYEMNYINNIVLDFNELNALSLENDEIFFKVGVKYGAGSPELTRLALSFDKRLLQISKKVIDTDKVSKKILDLKNDGYFILWFGVCSEKRKLINQVELLKKIVGKLSEYHKICIIVDGVTSSSYQSNRNIVSPLMISDGKVLEIIERDISISNLVSLIGATSLQKIAAASLVDFHVTSTSTGSLWPSRIAKKSGVMHISQAFYRLTQLMHLHYSSLNYPNVLVEDIVVKGEDPRVDYVSYNVDENEFLNFIQQKFPNIFTQFHQYKRINVHEDSNIEYLDEFNVSARSVSNDPLMILSVEELTNIIAPYTLSILGYLKTKQNLTSTKFYLDYGQGFNENDTVLVNLKEDELAFNIDVTINRPLHGLRFDPIEQVSEFEFNGLFYKLTGSRKCLY